MIASELFTMTSEAEFDIPRSLRFRSNASTYLTKVFASGDIHIGTTSFWIKRGTLSTTQNVISTGNVATTYATIYFDTNDKLNFLIYNSGTIAQLITTQVFRDPSAWYHITVNWDSTLAISSDRIKMYINGVRITSFATTSYPSQNLDMYLLDGNGSTPTQIGYYPTSGNYLDGYLAEFYGIYGQALDPTNFGKIDSISGQWVAKKYAGSYGTNGFYLDFKDNTSLTTLGYDKSGNNNHWTTTNISLTAGTTYDSMIDTPTNNYPTLNPLTKYSTLPSPSLGNLQLSVSATATQASIFCSQLMKNDFYYCEITIVSQTLANAVFGVGTPAANIGYAVGNSTNSWGITPYTGAYYKMVQGVQTNPSYATMSSTGTYGMAIDAVNGKVWVTDQTGTWISGDPVLGTSPLFSSLPTSDGLIVMLSHWSVNSQTTNQHVNFGQRPFAYTPPSGFLSLCSKNLPAPSIKRGETGFDIATYTGNGGNLQIGEYQFPRFNYQIDKSLRFRSTINSNLSKSFTAGSAETSDKIKSLSVWVKLTGFNSQRVVLSNAFDNSNYWTVMFDTNNKLQVFIYQSGSLILNKVSTQSFIDSNWHNIIISNDTTNSQAEERTKIFIDGIRLTSFTTNVNQTQNASSLLKFIPGSGTWNGRIGTISLNSLSPFDGYLAEMHLIDGQALTPTSFGEFDINGYWIPKAYTETYGTNGFYLDFKDNSALANLGYDKSGNNNNWTPNNFSLTAGVTYDSMIDSPTNNFATFNQLDSSFGTRTILNGGLTVNNAGNGNAYLTHPVSSGKWYLEVKLTAQSGAAASVWTGFVATATHNTDNAQNFNPGIGYCADGTKIIDGSVTTYGATYTIGDTLGVALDIDNGSLTYYKNGVSQGTISRTFKGIGVGSWTFYANSAAGLVSNTWELNCGQYPFAYTPPNGYKTLSIPNIAEYVYDLESPDLVWIKSRNAATNHMLFDSVRGSGKYLSSNLTAIEATDVNSLIQFNKNGFYLGNNAAVNTLNNTYVAWMWKAGTNEVTNTDGTITSQVRANPNLGFSVVKYIGNGVNATFGHGLGVKPKMVIIKSSDYNSVNANWAVWFEGLAGPLYYLLLNSNVQQSSSGTSVWNSLSPTSTVVNLGPKDTVNNLNSNYIAYCFAEIEGFSKFGSYIGNGSADGPFVYCGFKPRFVLIKRIDTSGSWNMFDIDRDFNRPTYRNDIYGQLANAETTTGPGVDFLSNGFKCRDAGGIETNTSGGSYIYAAFAEAPFKYATAR